MNTTTLRTRALIAARFTATLLTMTGLALMAAGRWTWTHRQQIKQTTIRVFAALVVAAQFTYRAGRWTRRQLLALSDRAAQLTAEQPLPALAPIVASIEALREALARLIARLYPEVAV